MTSGIHNGQKREWHLLATAVAKDAHENHFSTRRGTCGFDGQPPGIVGLYNNNPYAGDPERRSREEALLRKLFAARGLRELGYAAFPADGEDAGYTTAMIVGPLPADVDVAWINTVWDLVLRDRIRPLPEGVAGPDDGDRVGGPIILLERGGAREQKPARRRLRKPPRRDR